MVKGLDLFREHFREYTDRYVLIGGTSCDLTMEEVGLPFRATKDLDIVLCVEALENGFHLGGKCAIIAIIKKDLRRRYGKPSR